MLVPETEVIITQDGQELLRRILRPGEYTIGRSPACELCVASTTVSRKHAKLTLNYSNLFLEDLGSFNGTTVNSGRISGKTQIWHGQRIKLGNASLQLRKIIANTDDGVSLAPAQSVVAESLPEDVTFQHSGYEIGQLIGRGGMGAVLQAEDASLERQVAMKVILHGDSPGDVARFINEARITGKLEHPNIVPVHSLGADEHGQPFYTMKLVRGSTLRQVLGALSHGEEAAVRDYPLSTLLTVFQKVCDGIRFAHSQKVIHRDLKPDNVMLGNYGEVLVMDWGLAKKIGAPIPGDIQDPLSTSSGGIDRPQSSEPLHDSNTLTGAILGTPQYMPPEQARGDVEALDERADIYSLGAILYHILTLQPPIPTGSREVILDKVIRGEIVSPSEAVQSKTARHSKNSHKSAKHPSAEVTLAPQEGAQPENVEEVSSDNLPHLPAGHIPASLEAVVLKAIAQDPAERYASVGELQEDLSAYQQGFATNAEHAGNLKLAYLFLKRNRTVSLAGLLSFCFALGLGVQSYRSNQALERLRKAAPTFADQANVKLLAGRPQDALEKIGFAVEVDPENAEYQLLNARLLQAGARLPEAAAAFKRVLAIRKDLLASENLELTNRLIRRHGSGAVPLTAKATLLAAFQRQGRAKDGSDMLAEMVAKAPESARQLEQRMAPVSGWNPSRLRQLADGTFNVNLTGLTIESLEMLEDMPVSELKLDNAPSAMSTAWQGSISKLPLRSLSLRSSHIGDISFLAETDLESLDLSDNPLSELTPLQGLPLRELNIAKTSAPDITPLGSCSRLEQVVLPQSARNVETLKALPSLKRLSNNESYGGASQSAQEFWNKYTPPAPKAP